MDASQLLLELKEEREKYTSSDKAKMQALVDQLIVLGVYPAVSKINLPALSMVDAWGVYWHEWREPLCCPHCSANLCDQENGPPFKREIAIYCRELDETVMFRCPDCENNIGRIR